MKRARDIREQLVNLMERVEIELVSDVENHGEWLPVGFGVAQEGGGVVAVGGCDLRGQLVDLMERVEIKLVSDVENHGGQFLGVCVCARRARGVGDIRQ